MNESTEIFTTESIEISATKVGVSQNEVSSIADLLDTHRGVLLTSRFEYPGRYTRFDIGIVDPPLVLESKGNQFSIEALNARGELLLDFFFDVVSEINFVETVSKDSKSFSCVIIDEVSSFLEEDRSKMPHVMNVIRALRNSLKVDDNYLGFYGAFGYDLGMDFLGLNRINERDDQRDLVLYFTDRVYVTDHQENESYRMDYEFTLPNGTSTAGIDRSVSKQDYIPSEGEPSRDFQIGEYSQIVDVAKEYFARGDLFEVVPSQTFCQPCRASPATVFHQLLELNPAPYGALINLGNQEWTVSASPEMFVRVEGNRVESCPIAGTIARGSGEITDEQQIQTLLDSKKEESELTMCTDVDRNDKSRVCMPETINVIGRRQIEIYSRLIHTVDHVEGYLKEGYDSIDAFLSHMWAVTVTGAPKQWAMNFIEEFEKSPRRFYGGSMGFIGVNGSMNTGLMLRTIHFRNGYAYVRVGATLLMDSDPILEEKETELKASAILEVINYCHQKALGNSDVVAPSVRNISYNELQRGEHQEMTNQHLVESEEKTKSCSVLLIDCEDSFVHTLAGYFRMSNADVHTRRIGFSGDELEADFKKFKPDFIVLSPGPGSPSDFGISSIIDRCRQAQLPIFGVCLGLQAIVEYFGGSLSQLDEPVHGKASGIILEEDSGFLFEGLASPFGAGRYHSLYANEDTLPDELKITARSSDGVIMAIEHISEPMVAVQFHPESIMTMENNAGRKIISNVVDRFAQKI